MKEQLCKYLRVDMLKFNTDEYQGDHVRIYVYTLIKADTIITSNSDMLGSSLMNKHISKECIINNHKYGDCIIYHQYKMLCW